MSLSQKRWVRQLPSHNRPLLFTIARGKVFFGQPLGGQSRSRSLSKLFCGSQPAKNSYNHGLIEVWANSFLVFQAILAALQKGRRPGQLTYLFLRICETRDGEPLPQDILLAVWNAVPNDRMQREMLRRAAIVRFGRHEKTMLDIGVDIAPIRQNEQKILDEVLWILERADGLGRQRDDAAHVPTVISISDSMNLSDAMLEIMPLDSLEHPIAKPARWQKSIRAIRRTASADRCCFGLCQGMGSLLGRLWGLASEA